MDYDFKSAVAEKLTEEFGEPSRDRVKVKSWNLPNDVGLVLQMDQPNRESAAYIWLPYPDEGQPVPEFALEYAGESGRHSNTYPASGLAKGLPALKLTIRSMSELGDVIQYARSMSARTPLPEVRGDSRELPEHSLQAERASQSDAASVEIIDPKTMPAAQPKKPRREAIPRTVQREVWQRDGGQCVECASKERLCFDHIVPFSRGGANTVRNLQLLCEPCNLSKNNRI